MGHLTRLFSATTQETIVMEQAKARTEFIGIKCTPLEKAAIVYGQRAAGVASVSEYLRKSGLSIAKTCAQEMMSRNDESLAG